MGITKGENSTNQTKEYLIRLSRHERRGHAPAQASIVGSSQHHVFELCVVNRGLLSKPVVLKS